MSYFVQNVLMDNGIQFSGAVRDEAISFERSCDDSPIEHLRSLSQLEMCHIWFCLDWLFYSYYWVSTKALKEIV